MSTEVVKQVAEKERTPATELPLLYEAIDADALDQLFTLSSRSDRETFRVEFQYAGYRVTVDTGGDVSISPLDV